MIADRAAFILENTRPRPVPHVPEIILHVADEAVPLWQKTEEELGELGLPPPFWAFAWAGGQALARYLIDHPGTVRGRRVLDLATGSGLVAIAAAKAGATGVEAFDIDDVAIVAVGLNAALNGVSVAASARDLLDGPPTEAEVVLAADVFYERDMADRVLAFLDRERGAGAQVFVGDPGRSYLPRERLEPLATYEVPVTRDLEDREIRRTVVYRLTGAGG